MAKITVTESRTIDAPPAILYAILADYTDGHRRILPGTFRDLEVERGGVGEGTVIQFRLRFLGISRRCRAQVTEPSPGRVLAETDLNTGSVTTFTVEPMAGKGALITIATAWDAQGPAGFVERVLAPPLLRRVYRAELDNLARIAQNSRTN